jgi:hypothetical protein
MISSNVDSPKLHLLVVLAALTEDATLVTLVGPYRVYRR